MFYGALKSSNYAQHDDVYDAVNSYNYTENSNVLCFFCFLKTFYLLIYFIT